MGKAEYAFLCILLVLPIFAQCEQLEADPQYTEIYNAASYLVKFARTITYSDGEVVTTDEYPLPRTAKSPFPIPLDVISVVTRYTLVRTQFGLSNRVAQVVDWALNGMTLPTLPGNFWTVNDQGFWIAPNPDPGTDECLVTEWTDPA